MLNVQRLLLGFSFALKFFVEILPIKTTRFLLRQPFGLAREIDFAERKKSEVQKPVYDNAPVQSAPTPQGQNEDHNNNQEQFNTNFQNPPFGNPDDFNDFEDPFGGFGGFEGSLDGNLPFQ